MLQLYSIVHSKSLPSNLCMGVGIFVALTITLTSMTPFENATGTCHKFLRP